MGDKSELDTLIEGLEAEGLSPSTPEPLDPSDSQQISSSATQPLSSSEAQQSSSAGAQELRSSEVQQISSAAAPGLQEGGESGDPVAKGLSAEEDGLLVNKGLSGYGRSSLLDDWASDTQSLPEGGVRKLSSVSDGPDPRQDFSAFASRESMGRESRASDKASSAWSQGLSAADAKRKSNFDKQQFVARKHDEIKRQLEALTFDSTEEGEGSKGMEFSAEQFDLLKKLKLKVEQRLSDKRDYRGLLGFAAYVMFYFAVVFVQLETSTGYDVEQSLHEVYVQPLEGRTLSEQDVYGWLEDPIVDVFQNEICGNGKCEFPSEFPTVGRFGCEKDCGRFPNVSTVYVRSSDPRLPAGKTRSEVPYLKWLDENGREPTYRWNAWSDTLQRFIFEQNRVPDFAPVNFEVPDGILQICKFQENQIYGDEVSPEVLAQTTGADQSSIPPVPEWQGFSYGTFSEAVAYGTSVQVEYLVSQNATIAETGIDPFSSGLSYGLDELVFNTDTTGAIETASVKFHCQLNSTELQATLTTNNCPGTLPVCYNLTKMEELWVAKGCEACNVVQINNFNSGPNITNPIPGTSSLRSVTPSNYLIGAISLYQTRWDEALCRDAYACGESCQRTREKNFGRLANSHRCKKNNNNKPFGIDPTFFESSPLYDGSIPPSFMYSADEFEGGIPHGFYPMKDSIASLDGTDSGNQFAAYIDARMTSEEARRAVSFLKEGFFIDNLTDTVQASFLTYNGESDIIAKLTVKFKFNLGGGVELSSNLASISLLEFMDLTFSYAVAVIVLAGAIVQILPEIKELRDAAHAGKFSTFWPYNPALIRFSLSLLSLFNYRHASHLPNTANLNGPFIMAVLSPLLLCSSLTQKTHNHHCRYVSDPWNILDWYAFIMVPFSLFTFIILAHTIRNNCSFVKDGQGNHLNALPTVLRDPSRKNRLFQTNWTEEERLFNFLQTFTWYTDAIQTYQVFVAINVVVLIFRLLKVMDFQGRMGLITRTLGRSFQDILHFLLLYYIVVASFAIMGQKLYGRQMDGFKNFDKSLMTLFQLTLGIGNDPYAAMIQANDSVQWFTTIYYICFVILSSVVLLNILLAILVDAFGLVKETAQESESLYGGVRDTCLYDVNRTRFALARYLGRAASSSYLSDEKLHELLEAYLSSIDKTDLEEVKLTKEEAEDQKVLQLDDDFGLTGVQLAGLILLLIKNAPATVQEANKVANQKKWMKVRGQVVNTLTTVATQSSRDSSEVTSRDSSDQGGGKPPVNKALKLWQAKPSGGGAASSDTSATNPPGPLAPEPDGAEKSAGNGEGAAASLMKLTDATKKSSHNSQEAELTSTSSSRAPPTHLSKMLNYWESVGKDIGAAQIETSAKNQIGNTKLRRMVRILMTRYGKEEDDDVQSYLNKMKLDVLNNQVDFYKRYYDLESKVTTIDDAMAETMTAVDELRELLGGTC